MVRTKFRSTLQYVYTQLCEPAREVSVRSDDSPRDRVGRVGGVTSCWQLPRTLPAPLYLLAAPCNTTSAPCGGCWGAPCTIRGRPIQGCVEDR
jgi:hypothetical protein